MTRTVRVLSLLLALAAWGDASAAAQRLEWHEEWRRPGSGTWATTALFGASSLTLSLTIDTERPFWLRANRFDQAGNRGLGARRSQGERVAAVVSDVFGVSLLAVPLTLHPAVALADGEGVSGPLISVAMLSYATATLAVSLLKYLTRRERPLSWRCLEDGRCGAGQNRSFPSGHAALGFTAAALSCTFHQHVGTFGSRIGDAMSCGVGLGMATTTALLRVVARRHHLSDVALGALIGFAAGWLLPSALTFGFRSPR